MEPVTSEMQSDSTDPALPVLFLFAHNDDEIFISATLQLLAGRGDVSAVWVTRGGLHGGKREAESRRAMDILGVDPQRLHFFRLADGRALDYADEVISRLTRLILRLKPASVFVPAFEGGHPDHDIVQLAAAEAIRRGAVDRSGARRRPALYEFPLYNRCATRFLSVGEFIPDATPTLRTAVKLRDRLIRRKLMVTFRSQRPITWPLLSFKGGPMMLHHAGEPYRCVPVDRDYTVRPHQGRLAYELYTSVRFGRFAEKAALLQAG